MESTKNLVEQGCEDENEHERVSDVASSGVRVERETTPAPPSVTEDGWAASYPSARPTSVPDYDVAAIAFETSLRHHAPPSLPLDIVVPRRTLTTAPAELELRACFLLLHVDGRSSVRDIAELTVLPVTEVLAGILALAALGLVEMGGNEVARAVPASGERRR
jgi:hypothetical protein